MASVFHLCCEATHIKQKVVNKYSEFAASDKKLYFSAVAIQRLWRGYFVRQTIKDWNKKAITIQRFVRGWLARIHLPERLKDYFYYLSAFYYNQQATIIQAFWRGYCVNIYFNKDLITLLMTKVATMVRKSQLSVKSVMRVRSEIQMVNREMQEQLKEAFDQLRASAWNETRHYVEKILMMLFDRHHLLRTRVQEGVFSLHGSNELSCIERILDSFPLKDYMTQLNEIYQNKVPEKYHKTRKTRFDLSTTIKSKPYEKMLGTQN